MNSSLTWRIPPPFDQERDDWGAIVLAEWAESVIERGQRVLIVGAGAGAVGLPLARKGAHVTFCDDNVVALEAAQRTFAQARREAAFCSTLELHDQHDFDMALLNILWWTDAARGRALIELAARSVRPRGIIALAGGKNAGITTAERDLKVLCGSISAPLYKKGHRVVVGLRPATLNTDHAEPQPRMIELPHGTLMLEQQAGIFADGGLDPATAMLIEAIELPTTGRVLDLGCGAGVLGMALQLRQPNLSMTYVDANVIATDTTRRNLELNHLQGRVLASDSIAAVADEQFDLVVTNPPFHVGRIKTQAIAEQFIRDAATLLAPNGSFWLVANRFLRYEPAIEHAFGNVREAASDSKFKVLHAILGQRT